MKWILYTASFLVLIVIALFAVAFSLPAHTVHTRSVKLRQPPDKVFAVLADVQSLARWNRSAEKVEVMPPIDGKEATRQTFHGGMVMLVITTESAAPHHLVRVLGDAQAPFSGTWSYQITATPDGGSEVELTEVSEISKPLYRLMVKLYGPTKHIDEHLEDLNKAVGPRTSA